VKDLCGNVGGGLQLIADDFLELGGRQGPPRFDPRVLAGSVLVLLSTERQSQEVLVQMFQA